MLPLVTTKYLVPLTIIAVLSVTETDAQMDPDGNLVANNGIAIQRVISGGSDRRISQPSQPSQAPSGQGLNAFQTILAGFLLGSIYGRGFPYSPPYGYYYPYFGYPPYYGYLPYYYYYYG
uniref:Secreted protein n=1 Tax=Loa loa TaxID=7209 RepID=A0A1I7VEK1_LOALO